MIRHMTIDTVHISVNIEATRHESPSSLGRQHNIGAARALAPTTATAAYGAAGYRSTERIDGWTDTRPLHELVNKYISFYSGF